MIYVIGDLHLSFGSDKPMDIFGGSWKNHTENLKEKWENKVKENDSIIIAGDFSWGISLEEALPDFKFLESLPGTKYLLKGNHDYWWSTVTKMSTYLKENNIYSINFLYNNSYIIDGIGIVGTKGWSTLSPFEEFKNLRRENARLALSIEDLEKREKNGEKVFKKICIMHYPPLYRDDVLERFKKALANDEEILKEAETSEDIPNIISSKIDEIDFLKTMKDANIQDCYYGHLHGNSHKEATVGMYNGINFHLIAGDYIEFDLKEVK